MDRISKWSPGGQYGPVLHQTDLYLLNPPIDIHPILAGKHSGFNLICNLSNGVVAGYTPDQRDREIPFFAKEEPATLPRTNVMYILTEISPWCTTIRNEKGITCADVTRALWKDYSEHYITEQEFEVLPPRLKEQVRRTGQARASPNWAAMYSPAAQTPPSAGQTTFKRFDWLRDRCYFEAMRKDDAYAEARLGFKAPNVFILTLTA
ncbi:hypothetical protein CYLTODRAFT_373875 [Cylindrobasidium torrendii FP15055 ss-10]|uniref:DUF6699 domain-containing protein n=1 Tax=Cylindrobasidium torrendii FP15055 ss-10 TaxID=1314674 RepID=A0A0D7BE72_9AGAR|nr:hypothetical protein CYLTODRAFT_373875 [Cylindrobasidium torrendii FP15055 ss-10]